MGLPTHIRYRWSWLALGLTACGLPAANAQEWEGGGPILNDAGTRKVYSLAIDPATGSIYAGSGAGTVFVRTDATLSEPPVASDDGTVVEPGGSIDIDVLANDFDPEGALDPASVQIQSAAAAGTVAVTADGTVTYIPDPSFTGIDVFTYTVRDRAGNASNAASVTVRVNAPPVAGDDAVLTQEDASVTIDVLANDSDPDGTLDASAVAVWNSPANGGTAVEPDGRITYIPAPGWLGTESFTYKVGDGDGALSNEAVVTVTVLPRPNAAPVARDDSATAPQGTAVIVPVLDNDSDADGTVDPATVAVESGPAHGGAEVNADGSITYTPNADFAGDDSFTYSVADNFGESSNIATVTVSVSPADDPPASAPPSPSPEPAPAPRGGGATELPMLALLVIAILLRRRLATG